MVHTVVSNLPISHERLSQLKHETNQDPQLQAIFKMIRDGWPNHKHQVPAIAKPFWNVRNELHSAEGIILKDQKIVIPLNMQPYLLDLLHKSHLGVEKTKARARSTIYWPGMSSHIEEFIMKCTICLSHRYQNRKKTFNTRPQHFYGVKLGLIYLKSTGSLT